MLERRWYDETFVRRWTNAARCPCGSTPVGYSRAAEIAEPGRRAGYMAWDPSEVEPLVYDPAAPTYGVRVTAGAVEVATADGRVSCRPVLEHLRMHCEAMTPGRPRPSRPNSIVDTGRTLWTSRPVALAGAASSSTATRPR